VPRFQFISTGNDDGIRWRLASGNHRVLGTSGQPFGDLATARADAAVLRAEVDALVTALVCSGDGRWWGWELHGPGASAARVAGPRSYRRRVECRLSVHRFLSAAATAPVETRLLVHPGGGAARSSRPGGPPPLVLPRLRAGGVAACAPSTRRPAALLGVR
jgi:hypothetical protein